MNTNSEKDSSLIPKYLVIPASISLIVLAVYLSFSAVGKWQNLKNPLPPTRTLSIDGNGKELIIPNVGKVTFGVQSIALTTKDVVAQNSRAMNSVLDAIRAQGIVDKDITTQNYSLSPRWEYDPRTGQSRNNGWQLDQNIKVIVRDLDKIGEIISAATNAGANQVGDLHFEVDDITNVSRAARMKAISDARAKAEQIAAATGMKLGKIVGYNEGNAILPPQYPQMLARTDAQNESMPPGIQPGQQEVSISVNLIFELQ